MEQLLKLLEYGVTSSHVIDFLKNDLCAGEFQKLELEEKWKIENAGSYYVDLYGTNCAAFRIGNKITSKPVFRIAMAHSDYPCFQIKPNPIISGSHVTRLNVEIYGGMFQKSWLDRPLGIAGKVIVRGNDVFSPKILLYRSKGAMCIIPSLAIHMDRELNKKGALDVSKELVPLTALSEDVDLLEIIAGELGVDKEEILDYDLYLYNAESVSIVGADQSMLASPRLDNLTSVAAILSGLKECKQIPDNTIDMLVVFDNEEVGSLTKQGADSELLSMILQKIGESVARPEFAMEEVIRRSFLLSVDVAHANHPNYEEKSDVTNKAYLGQGFSIKRSVGHKYGTTAESAAVLKQICEANQIPYTIAINKSGIPGGSTLGPIVSSHLPIPCADIGMPVLAMHSALEVGAVNDYNALQHFMKVFFETV